jgi:hypothetical protein
VNKLEFLMPGEMEKTQGQSPACVLNVDQVASAGALSDLDGHNIPFDQDRLTSSGLGNRRQSCPIFIAKW